METLDLKAYLAERKAWVEEALDRYLPPASGLEKRVVEAARYSLSAGGKRLRPILCMAASEVAGADPRSVMPLACAWEMIHTYSLIHDDLPAMDNDDFRRGVPTNHKVFGEAAAILAGDTLLTEAFGLIASAAPAFPPGRLLAVTAVVSRAAGWRGMIGGQMIDLDSEGREVDLATVEYMHVLKTGAIIRASLETGAMLSGAPEAALSALRKYGHHLGLAFQITDDLLDVEGDAAEMGKTPGSDAARNKKTYTVLLGLPQAKAAAREHVERAVSALAAFGGAAEPLRAVARYLLVRKS